jgi:hypothetical protein
MFYELFISLLIKERVYSEDYSIVLSVGYASEMSERKPVKY